MEQVLNVNIIIDALKTLLEAIIILLFIRTLNPKNMHANIWRNQTYLNKNKFTLLKI